LGSSFIETSLHGKVTTRPASWARLVLLVFVVVGRVGSAPAQAPPSQSSELPRFTLRQIVIGRNDSLMRIPGPWFRASTALLPESVTTTAYEAAANRAGVKPLRGSALGTDRSQHVMGLYRREELRAAARQTLEAIRSTIPSDTTRARFDRIFRYRGEWILDLHDAALAWARSRRPELGWDAARTALTAGRWLAPDSGVPTPEAIPRALYSLAVLAATDSTAFAAAEAGLWQRDSTSAAAAVTILRGYTEVQRWYVDAIKFFLREPWLPWGSGRSLRDHVRVEWGRIFGRNLNLLIPQVETRWFGYPQALPRYGVPKALFRHLINADNPSASDWLQRNGEQGLLRTLRWLPAGDTSLALLRTNSETLRLTTVSRQSRESLNGFLEPVEMIAIDPGYSPLLALGAIVHEWQHLLFRRVQLETFAQSLPREPRRDVLLPGLQPHLAEGFAEWSSERILAPVTARWPLLGLGELEKRADLARRGDEDQHTLGYALVRTLASALPNSAEVLDLLLRFAEHPTGISSHPALRRAWRGYRDAPDQVLLASGYRLLIPEVTFTVEDGFPDVIATRILVPPGNDAGP
jgi:hypothetical protein